MSCSVAEESRLANGDYSSFTLITKYNREVVAIGDVVEFRRNSATGLTKHGCVARIFLDKKRRNRVMVTVNETGDGEMHDDVLRAARILADKKIAHSSSYNIQPRLITSIIKPEAPVAAVPPAAVDMLELYAEVMVSAAARKRHADEDAEIYADLEVPVKKVKLVGEILKTKEFLANEADVISLRSCSKKERCLLVVNETKRLATKARLGRSFLWLFVQGGTHALARLLDFNLTKGTIMVNWLYNGKDLINVGVDKAVLATFGVEGKVHTRSTHTQTVDVNSIRGVAQPTLTSWPIVFDFDDSRLRVLECASSKDILFLAHASLSWANLAMKEEHGSCFVKKIQPELKRLVGSSKTLEFLFTLGLIPPDLACCLWVDAVPGREDFCCVCERTKPTAFVVDYEREGLKTTVYTVDQECGDRLRKLVTCFEILNNVRRFAQDRNLADVVAQLVSLFKITESVKI